MGCLNGIGGKIEKGELPIQAAYRELVEESGVELKALVELGYMYGTNNDGSDFKVWVFTTITNRILKTVENEEISIYHVDEVKNHKHIENVPMLIEACLYKLYGRSHFSKLIMEY